MRVHQLIKRYPEFEDKDIHIITLFAAEKAAIQAYAGKQDAPFPMIANPEMEVCQKYRIQESSSGMIATMLQPVKMPRVLFSGFFNMKSVKDRPLMPADFLIDENQRIFKAYYGKDFGDHVPIEEILEWEGLPAGIFARSNFPGSTLYEPGHDKNA